MNDNFKLNSFYKAINKSLLLMQQKNVQNFQETNKHYYAVLKNYANLVKQLQLKNSLEVCIFFTCLLWNGYFSATRKNAFSNDQLLSKSGVFGFDVMTGKGVCINHSALLRDFLLMCGYESATLANIYDNDVIRDNTPTIRRRIKPLVPGSEIKSFFMSPLQKILGNHEFNLIKENDCFYIYDSSNVLLLNLRNFNTAKVVNGKGTFKLKTQISIGNNLPPESANILKELCNTKRFKQAYSKEEFIETFNIILNIFKSKREIINYFYELSYDDICFVANTVEENTENKLK